MSRISHEKITEFGSSSNRIAIGLGFTDKNQLHCGILYKVNSAKTNGNYFLHLAFHNMLKEDDESQYLRQQNLQTFKFIPFDKLPPERITVFVNRCRQIYNANKGNLGYAPKFSNSYFRNNGTVHLGKKEFGLTCATFVMAVFQDNQFKLVEPDLWPRRHKADAAWHSQIVNMLRKYQNHCQITEEHIKNVQDDNNDCKRFKPEEVAAASTSKVLPSKYWYAWFVGSHIREQLDPFLEAI